MDTELALRSKLKKCLKKNQKRKAPREFFDYSQESLELAMRDVTENGVCKYRAAKKFGIPRSTLIRKLSGKSSLGRRMGPETILKESEEKILEEWLLAMCRKGFPMQRCNLLLTVQKIVEESKRKTCFKEGMPGRTWFKSFLRRHPNVKLKYTESVAKARSAVTKEGIERWFSDVLQYLKEENLEDILHHPNRIFNGAVCDFPLDRQNRKVLGPAKCTEDIYERTPNIDKKQVAVMATCSASGESVPPMIIFPYKKFSIKIGNSVPGNWALGRSDSGCITSEVFYEYIGNHFLTYLRSHKIQKPVLLFVDGRRIHFTKYVSELCDLNGIIMMSVHPNSAHILQPTDVSIFKPLKLDWESISHNWKLKNLAKHITKETFGKVIASVFVNYWNPETIKNGFKQCGFFPFDTRQIDYNSKWINKGTITCSHVNRKGNSQNYLEDILSEIEKRIDPEELIRFKDTYYNNDEWSCKIESEDLYNFWSKAKKDLESSKGDSVQQTECKFLEESQNDVKYIVESFMQRPCRRIPTSSEVMKAAVKEIIKGGCKLRTTAKKYNIDKMTLRRYVLKYKQHGDDTKFVPNFKFSQIFTDQEEESLADYLFEASKMNYGLTSKDIRTLAFGYALEHQKKLPANWLKNQAASYDWLRGFMSRNTKLSLRTPEPTRLGRKSTFNEQTVEKFFEIYGEIWDREKLQPRLIYTYDETVLQTAYRPSNMLSQRRVSKELVETVTVCGAVNAIGNSVPPMLIFPREREEEYMTRGAPPCAQVVADPGGSMTVEKFEKYLSHFVKFVRCTPKERVILILDNHTSHISSKVFKFCKSNGIILFTIPPHTSHRLLPLQISVFRPFKTFFAHACHNFMMNHPGETVTLKNITPLINEAFLKAFRALFICQGFKRTGLYPFDPYIFTEYDFLSETFINPPEVLREDTPESEVTDAIAEPSELDSKPSSPTDIIPFTKSENGGMQLVKSEIWTDTFNFEEIKEEMI